MSEEYTILAEECGELTQACCKRIWYGEGEEQRKKLEGRDSSKAYNLHIQNYPLTVEEAFLKTKGSRFDLSLINAQRGRIMGHNKFKNQIQRGRLEWVFDDEDGFIEQVEWVADKGWPYLILEHPVKYTHLLLVHVCQKIFLPHPHKMELQEIF